MEQKENQEELEPKKLTPVELARRYANITITHIGVSIVVLGYLYYRNKEIEKIATPIVGIISIFLFFKIKAKKDDLVYRTEAAKIEKMVWKELFEQVALPSYTIVILCCIAFFIFSF